MVDNGNDDGGVEEGGVVVLEEGIAVVEVVIGGEKDEKMVDDADAGDVRPPQVHGPVPNGIWLKRGEHFSNESTSRLTDGP